MCLQFVVYLTILIAQVQGDQKVFVHLIITTQKVTNNVQSVPLQCPEFIDTILALTPSIIPNSNYVIMVSD
jgi:hypothetical protein